ASASLVGTRRRGLSRYHRAAAGRSVALAVGLKFDSGVLPRSSHSSGGCAVAGAHSEAFARL
ncbi:MAG: hypothetical protein M3R62_15335, partial [Acidobacteriota bacterium]|nr:hypothetical protein [Acidobacteriota bacterium]